MGSAFQPKIWRKIPKNWQSLDSKDSCLLAFLLACTGCNCPMSTWCFALFLCHLFLFHKPLVWHICSITYNEQRQQGIVPCIAEPGNFGQFISGTEHTAAQPGTSIFFSRSKKILQTSFALPGPN